MSDLPEPTRGCEAWERYLPQNRRPKPEQIADLLRHLAMGGTTRDWLRDHPMVHPFAPSLWASTDETIKEAISEAKLAGNERSMEACLAISADESLDIDRAKLMVQTRMRVLEKIDARYAEKSAVSVGGNAAVVANIQVITGVPAREVVTPLVEVKDNGRNGHG